MAAEPTERIFGLDLARTAAIAGVLAIHFTAAASRLSDFPRFGFGSGVELFFALSGFLIGGLLIDIIDRGPNWRAWRVFMARRWLRTVPLYLLWLVVLMVFLPPERDRAGTFLAYATFLQNLAWPMPRWFNVSWSLTVEEWFYLLFSAAVLPLGALLGRSAIPIAALAFIVVPLSLRFGFVDEVASPSAGMRKVVVFRLDAIAYGVFMIWLCRTFAASMHRWRWLLFALGAVMIAASNWPDYFVTGRSVVVVRLTLLPLGFALMLPAARSLVSAPPVLIAPIRWVSERAYGMYVVHTSLMAMALTAAGGSWKAALFGLALAFVGTFLLADLSWRYFEKPILRLRPRQSIAPPPAADAVAEARAGPS